MRIHVIRHGEAGDDIEEAYGGAANFRLTDSGRKQAADVGAMLAAENLDHIYTSPLARASESAEILSTALANNPAITTIAGLRERNSYGVLSGLPKAKAAELFDYILAELTEKPGYSREPLLGSEDFDQFILRVRQTFHDILDAATAEGFQNIALVTHGKFTQALCEHVLKLGDSVDLDFSSALSFEYTPASVQLLNSPS